MKIAGGNSTALISNCPERLRQEFSKNLLKKVEQVGFISFERKIPKLEMMGGELCINATLAFASQLKNKKGKLFTSGIKNKINYENKGKTTILEFPLLYKKLENTILFDKIGYILINNKNKEKISKKFLSKLAKKYKKPAFGAIVYEKNRIIPYVYVKRVDSFVQETACGSGSIAFNIFSGFNKVVQPTGEIIEVNIKKDKVFVSATVKEVKKIK